MAKRKKTDWKFITNVIINLAMLAVVVVFLLGAYYGWFNFGNFFNTSTTINSELKDALENPPSTSECSLDINPNVLNVGEYFTGTIKDGSNTYCEVWGYLDGDDVWKKIWEGTTNSNGVATETENLMIAGIYHFRAICDKNNNGIDGNDCITNEEVLSVSSITPPEDEGYDLGDNVGDGTVGNGNANFGDDLETIITMDWTTDGPYVLGAKITRSWNYVGDGCEGPEQYPMEWTLYDSNGMAWQKYDYFPVTNKVDTVCPVTYHEDSPWKFVVSVGIQACDVSYYWHVQPYICEVND